MSHNAKLGIEITDIDSFKEAIVNCNGDVKENEKTFKAYYGARVDCEFTFTVKDVDARVYANEMTSGFNRIGVVKDNDGKFSLRYDAWGINLRNAAGENNPVRCFGENFGKHRTAGGVHYPLDESKPNRLLCEYAAVVAEKYAKKNFMKSRRTVDANGRITVVLTGGHLRGSEEIHVIANEDGTSTMAAIGFDNKTSRCQLATAALEKILGVKLEDKRLGDYFHDTQGNHLKA